MNTKRILQVNAYYGVGSTGHIVQDIKSEGNRRGLDMYAVYWMSRKKELENNHVLYCGRTADTMSSTSKIIQWVLDGGKIAYNKEMTESIIRQITKLQPDIIHLHNLHGDFEYGMIDFPLLMNSIKNTKAKVVWTLHDCWAFTGRCYYFTYKQCDRWKTGCGHCPQRIYDREGVLFDRSASNLKLKKELYEELAEMHIITVSKWLEKMTRESVLRDKNIRTIYNGIDCNIFYPDRTRQRTDRKFRILCIGWDRRKGFRDYYSLSKKIGDDEEIVVVGNRPGFRSYKPLPINIHCVNKADTPHQMAEIYNSADVYFNASVAETFGLTTAEALACGIPVVGYDSTATPEVIGESPLYGRVVSPRNVDELYEAIQMIKEYKGDQKASIARCDRVKECFSKDRMVEEYMYLYNEIV